MSPCPHVSRTRGRLRSIAPVALLAVALAGAPVLAAGGESIDDRPVVSLSLDDCLKMAMDSNMDIAVERYNIDINGQGIDQAKAVYDSTVQTTYVENEINNQNANPFTGFPVVTDKTRRLTASWNDPTIWGGNFNVFFLGDKQKANFLLLRPQYSNAFSFTYQQSLLRNLGVDVNKAPVRIAQNTENISRSQFLSVVQDTVEAVEFAYWDLVFARMDLDVQRNARRLAQELLKMNKAKVEVGTMAPIDVTQAEAGVADREESVIVAEAAVLNAEDTLRQLLNPPPDSTMWASAIVPSDQPDFRLLQPDVDQAIQTAEQSRPDLAQQRLRVDSNQLQEMVDRTNKRWDLVLEGGYATEGLAGTITQCQGPPGTFPVTIQNPAQQDLCYSGELLGTATAPIPGVPVKVVSEAMTESIKELDNTQYGDWHVQATLTIPVGNRDRKARYAQSMLRHQQSQVQFDNLKLAAEIDVRRRVRDVWTNAKRVEAARKNRELQQENVDAEQKKFENGMSTSFQVLQVQDDLRNAERRENLAVVDYNKSLASLEKSKGTLLEARNIQLSDAYDADNQAASYGNWLRSADLDAAIIDPGR